MTNILVDIVSGCNYIFRNSSISSRKNIVLAILMVFKITTANDLATIIFKYDKSKNKNTLHNKPRLAKKT